MNARWKLLALGVMIAAVLAAVGRWETRRFERTEGQHILAVWRASAGLVPHSYRLAAPVDCLGFQSGTDPYALEACFDARGRLVEAIDRRGHGDSKLWSLQFDPSAAPLMIPPAQLIKRFQRLGVLRKYGDASYLPMPQMDEGPVYVRGAQ